MSTLDEAGDALSAACRPLFDDPTRCWCRDFLLGADPSSDVAILTDTRPLAHATIISVVMAGIEETGILRGAADGAVAIDFYLVPVVSVGERSVGMVVQRYSRGATVDYGTGRYAIHNHTGELFILWTESLVKENPRAHASSVATFSAVATAIHGRPPRLPPVQPPSDDHDNADNADNADDSDIAGNMSSSGSRASHASGNEKGSRTFRIQLLAPRRGLPNQPSCGTLAREMEDLAALCDASLFKAGRYKDSILVSHRTPDFNRHACEACMEANAGPAGNVEELSELFASACSCSAPLRIPDQTGLDWGAQISNVEAYGGLYRGLTDVNLCLPGASPSSVSFRKLTSSQLRVCRENFVSESIRQVALQSRMEHSNPWRHVVPVSYLQMQTERPTGPPGTCERPFSGTRFRHGTHRISLSHEDAYTGRTVDHHQADAYVQEMKSGQYHGQTTHFNKQTVHQLESIDQRFDEPGDDEYAEGAIPLKVVGAPRIPHLQMQQNAVERWQTGTQERRHEFEAVPLQSYGSVSVPLAEGQMSLPSRQELNSTIASPRSNPESFMVMRSGRPSSGLERWSLPQTVQHHGSLSSQKDPACPTDAPSDAVLCDKIPVKPSVVYSQGKSDEDVSSLPAENQLFVKSSSLGEPSVRPLQEPSLPQDNRQSLNRHHAHGGHPAWSRTPQAPVAADPHRVPPPVTPAPYSLAQSKPSAPEAVSIAPRPGQIGPGIVVDEAREKRIRERKQRNREAAARSNAQRREKNEALKEALRVTHEQAKELEKRKEELIRENKTLYDQLSTNNAQCGHSGPRIAKE